MNCHHNVAQLRRLREQFPDTLAVLGVHSAKFPAEKELANIREAVQRHGIDHPVANDADFDVWREFAVRAWPTVILIDARGRIVDTISGEIDADELGPRVRELVAQAEREGILDRAPLEIRRERDAMPEQLLRYPSKLLVTDDGRLFVADTGHHRVLELQLAAEGDLRSDGKSGKGVVSSPRATIRRTFGDGEPGLIDGSADVARFHDPHGMALVAREGGETLYVADTENHAIRAIDLADGAVRTVAGTGEKGGYAAPKAPLDTALRSPWALWADGEALLIAMAGSHQIWALIGERELGVFAGNGREALVDGPRAEASFNQPSDIDVVMGHLVVADSEASAIRAVRLNEDPRVFTLVGLGLFEWGDVDGKGTEVRLQHPTGLTAADDRIFIVDSYNHKVKTLDPGTGEVRALAGSGRPGATDGPLPLSTFFEPEGIDFDGDRIFVADTNNHVVRVIDLEAGKVATLKITQTHQ